MVFMFVKIILMNKMCKNHERLLVTELIFCNNPKAKGKSYWICQGNQGDATSRLVYKNAPSLQHSV